jgi:hypothetical protein
MPSSSRVAAGPPVSHKGNFTILLASFTLDNRAAQSQALQQRAKYVLKTEDIWLSSSQNQIDVNYGYFKTHKEALRQKKKVKGKYKSLRLGPYQFFLLKEIPRPDPPAPAEWNILNNRCACSLQVGSYYNVPEKNYLDRKADAVKAVESLRKDIDSAYFYHGEHESYVLIGCMPGVPSTPMLQVLQKKYPFAYENGFKVNIGIISGVKSERANDLVKTPKHSFLVDLARLTRTASDNVR